MDCVPRSIPCRVGARSIRMAGGFWLPFRFRVSDKVLAMLSVVAMDGQLHKGED